jgi:uncharacterized protein (TIGR02118 family)
MFKLLVLTKRKPGMSREQFRNYYEHGHAPLVQRITPLMRKYRRNYLAPVQGGPHETEELPFDCLAEVWFDREEDFRHTLISLTADPYTIAALVEDEEKLFDRSKTRWFTASEAELPLSGPTAQ